MTEGVALTNAERRQEIDEAFDRWVAGRTEADIGRFEHSAMMRGRPLVFANTRIPVRIVHDYTDNGYTPEQIRRSYPDLTFEDIEAALALREQSRAA